MAGNNWLSLKVLLATAALFSAGIFAIISGQYAASQPAQPEPRLVTADLRTVEARVVETHTVSYIERPITRVEYVNQVEKVPVKLRNYDRLDELKSWLAENQLNAANVYLESPEITADCDDFALALQERATAEGYIMSFQIIEPDKYNSLFENSQIPSGSLHAVNLVVIGNEAYYVEPQTGETVLAARLD